MAVLGLEELEELLDEIRIRVIRANQTDTLDQILTALGMNSLLSTYSPFSSKDGKIVVLGASNVDMNHLLITAGKLGIDKSRFEFCLDYDALEKYNYRKLQYKYKYLLIMVGPMPHSSYGKGESNSAIAEMEKRPEMYPRVIRMNTGSELKITKSGFKDTLQKLLQEGYI